MENTVDLESINAPQFFDFSHPKEDENVEDYFNFDHENGEKVVISEESFFMDTKESSPSPKKETSRASKNTPNDIKQPNDPKLQSPGIKRTKPTDTESKIEEKKTKSNICSDLSAWRKGAKIIENGIKAIRRSPRVKENSPDDSKAAKSTTPSGIPLRCDASPAMKKFSRRSAAATPEMAKERQKAMNSDRANNHSRTRSFDTKSAPLRRCNSLRSVSVEKRNNLVKGPTRRSTEKPSEKADKHKITLPTTPTFLKREMKFTHTGQVKSTEEIEMEKIREFQKTLAKQRKTQEQFRQKALAATGQAPCRPAHSGIPLTKPAEFHFKTDARLKNNSQDQRSESKDRDFVAQLRSHSISGDNEQKLLPKKTIPHPFSFDRKRKHDTDQHSKSGGEDKFMTMAEKINRFAGTPERYRSRPAGKDPSPAKRRRRSMSQPHLTLPKTPNLQTRGRSRPAHVKSQAQIDEEEVAEIQKYEFHAKPMNQKIFQNNCLGVRKVVPKEVTIPESFDLETVRRADTWKDKSDDKDESYHFHAKPVPRAILEGTVGVSDPKKIPLTMPESPAFALKHRLRSSIKVPDVLPQEERKVTKAKPAPHQGLPYQPKFERKVTEIEPFSFEERNQRTLRMKEEKIRKIQEEGMKVPEFHAKPIPDLSPVLPPKKTKPATKPEPFNFEVDFRGASKAEEWGSKMKEELKHQREMAHFKAQPNKVVNAEPFLPRKSIKPLTVIDDFELNSDSRAHQRELWESWKHEKEVEEMEMKHSREQQQHDDEQRDVERLRKEMVPKAQPVRKYKEVVLKPSEKELTQPHTPRFSERLKTRFVRL